MSNVMSNVIVYGDASLLFTSIRAAQASMEPVKKAATNPHFRSKFADLASVIEATVPPLNQHGCCVLQLPGWDEATKHVTLTTVIGHDSGCYLESTASAPVDKDSAQAVGSAITYLRRYGLQAALCLPTEDDDGNRASDRRAPVRQQRAAPAKMSALPPQPGQGEHDSWAGNAQRFTADVEGLGVPLPRLVAWCEAKGKGNPASWDNHRRGKLVTWLGLDGHPASIIDWTGEVDNG